LETWFTPWRYPYLMSSRSDEGCVFCAIRDSAADRENLVLRRGLHCYIVINRYPYSNGHVMVVPFEHCALLESVSVPARAEMIELAAQCESALRSCYNPGGFNLGMNVGKSAGAGIAEHIHLHVLPRWGGDTNFISVVGGTRIIPEALHDTYERLLPLLGPARQGGS
jgi:ATP adenylyltransferase